MHLTKCDVCGNTVKRGQSKLNISGNLVRGWGVDICEKCAKPYIVLLKKSDLLESENRA